MSRRDDRISIQQMLDHAREAVAYGAGKSGAEIEADRLLSLALFRLLEVLGEASKRVTERTRTRLTHIPWRDTSDFRNRLIHGYDTIDYDIVADVLRDDLPPLITQLEDALTNWTEA